MVFKFVDHVQYSDSQLQGAPQAFFGGERPRGGGARKQVGGRKSSDYSDTIVTHSYPFV